MSIDFQKAKRKILGKDNNGSYLLDIIVEYASLKKKLKDSSNQSWYFKMARESSNKKLIRLKKDFEKTRKIYNCSTLDEFIEQRNKYEKDKTALKKGRMSIIKDLHLSHVTNQLNYLNELIHLKSKTSELRSIDYYINHPDDCEVFFD